VKKAKNLLGFRVATDMPKKQKTANGFAGSATQIGAGRSHASVSVPGKIEANRSPAWILHRHRQDPGLGARVPSKIS
jgi:hypothetical protein